MLGTALISITRDNMHNKVVILACPLMYPMDPNPRLYCSALTISSVMCKGSVFVKNPSIKYSCSKRSEVQIAGWLFTDASSPPSEQRRMQAEGFHFPTRSVFGFRNGSFFLVDDIFPWREMCHQSISELFLLCVSGIPRDQVLHRPPLHCSRFLLPNRKGAMPTPLTPQAESR